MGFLKRRQEQRQEDRDSRASIMAVVLAALDDDILNEQEEDDLLATIEKEGWTIQKFWAEYPDLAQQVMLAKIADGRPPVLDQHELIAKPGEKVHVEFQAILAKEVVDREFQGGSRGISVPLGHGVRYRAGAFKGKSVVVGSHLEHADAGTFSVTSQRTVFQGSRRTVECSYSKILGVHLYADAIQISVSNRQKPSLFWVPAPQMVAALISSSRA